MDALHRVCRICERQEKLIDLTSQENADSAEKLTTVTTIRIRADDSLPRSICDKCSDTLNTVYDFLQQCKAAEQKWQEYRTIPFIKQEPLDIEDDQELLHGMIAAPSKQPTKGNWAEDEMEDRKDMGFEVPKIVQSVDGNRNEKFFCTTCGKSFDNDTERAHHALGHYVGRTSRSNLQNQEPREKKFACQSCNNSYKSRLGLRLHIKSIHMGEKPFKCSLCGKAFSRKSILQKHISTHDQERNVRCVKNDSKQRHG